MTGPICTPASSPLRTCKLPAISTIRSVNFFVASPNAEDLRFFECEVEPIVAAAAGGTTLAELVTEPSENNFPNLPIREHEHVLVRFARFDSRDAYSAHLASLAASRAWAELAQRIEQRLVAPTETLELEPTPLSALR